MHISSCNFSSIILAGGFSSRMGSFKPTMTLGNNTLIEHVISVYKSAGIKNIFIVTGNKSFDINQIVKNYNVRVIYNEKYRYGMFSSILSGIQHLPKSIEYFFIHPVDIPLVRRDTIIRLMNVTDLKLDIIYPIFNGKRGHPPLISTKLKDKIIDWQGIEGGLNECLRGNRKKFADVPVADEGILMDANTPRDFNALVSKFNKKYLLSPLECKILMKQIINTPSKIIEHCQIVANVAVLLTRNINNTGNFELDINLINSSALTHDIARIHVNHAKIGAEILKNMGYTAMGNIVEKHMNLNVNMKKSINESEIVYLADKLVEGNRLVDLKTKFRNKKIRYNNNCIVKDNILNRVENAYKVKNKIENIIPNKINHILAKNIF